MNGTHIYEDLDLFEDVFGDLDLTVLHSRERHKVFVYGTLMSGMRNNHRLQRDGVRKLDTLAATDPCADWHMFNRMTKGGYPAPVVVPGLPGEGKGVIRGEVYEVSNEVLLDLDRVEGHPEVYRRKKVFVVYSTRKGQINEKVWMYEYTNENVDIDYTDIIRIPIGDGVTVYQWNKQ